MPDRIAMAIKMRRPSLLDRVWYRRIRATPPKTLGRTFRCGRWARLVPYRFRRFHHAYAVSHAFFWLPCPLCGREFGGHEYGKDIPDPMRQPGGGMGICSSCSRTLAPESEL